MDLIDFCLTDHQRTVVRMVEKGHSQNEVARQTGADKSNISRVMRTVRERAAKGGYAPGHWEHGTAPGYTMGKVTVQRGSDGQVERTWERQSPEERAAQMLIDALDGFEPPKWKGAKGKPAGTNKELCALYTLTDFHLGMYAWHAETGDDWDADIASRVLRNAIEDMIQGQTAHDAILNLQGDFLHWDGLDAVTPTSQHVVDADTRFGRMVDLALHLAYWACCRLLETHKRVTLVVAEGNHDLAGSVWLRKALKKCFENEKRLIVDDTEFPYYAYLHGRTMLGFHHGHKMKNRELPALFASEPRYREMWGQATYTYIHTGHYHHAEQDMAEHGGAIVERHPTLAARDAHAARGGYVSRRAARVIIYHVDDGEVSRKTVLPR